MASAPEREIPLRIVVRRPPNGVTFAVQRGSSDLLAPTSQTADEVIFDFAVRVSCATLDGACRVLGAFTQGPPSARFVYVNSGQRAGQMNTRWNRRAKVPLVGITAAMIRAMEGTPEARLETEFEGMGSDGGPTCASVKSIVWRVERRAPSTRPPNDH